MHLRKVHTPSYLGSRNYTCFSRNDSLATSHPRYHHLINGNSSFVSFRFVYGCFHVCTYIFPPVIMIRNTAERGSSFLFGRLISVINPKKLGRTPYIFIYTCT